jgi:glutathione S-transferase/RNA polymerase-associated protein
MTGTIVLYEHPLSPYAQKIRILLREKNVPFECRLPRRLGRGGDNPELAELNPRLEVPALVHDGQTIFDSTIILEYLEETFPKPAMMPKSPIAALACGICSPGSRFSSADPNGWPANGSAGAILPPSLS